MGLGREQFVVPEEISIQRFVAMRLIKTAVKLV